MGQEGRSWHVYIADEKVRSTEKKQIFFFSGKEDQAWISSDFCARACAPQKSAERGDEE